METFQEAAIQMLREFRALLLHSPLPLPGTRLLQLLALNMFAIETTQLKGESTALISFCRIFYRRRITSKQLPLDVSFFYNFFPSGSYIYYVYRNLIASLHLNATMIHVYFHRKSFRLDTAGFHSARSIYLNEYDEIS